MTARPPVPALDALTAPLPATRLSAGETAAALAEELATPDLLHVAAVGDDIDLEALATRLETLGYVPDERVDEPGEVALRGQVLDVFPADAASPVRLEAADGTVLAIRPYDPVDQRATGDVVLPGSARDLRFLRRRIDRA